MVTTLDKPVDKNKLINSINDMRSHAEENRESCPDRYVDGYTDALYDAIETIKLQPTETNRIKLKASIENGSAREMFEKMGFDFCDRETRISYANRNKTCIIFSLITQEVDILFGRQERHYLEPSLYKAIHKQLLELGWLDD